MTALTELVHWLKTNFVAKYYKSSVNIDAVVANLLREKRLTPFSTALLRYFEFEERCYTRSKLVNDDYDTEREVDLPTDWQPAVRKVQAAVNALLELFIAPIIVEHMPDLKRRLSIELTHRLRVLWNRLCQELTTIESP